MDNSSANIKRGTIITYFTQFLGIGISFFYVPIMLGILGQDEYGLYALVQSIIAYFLLSDMGIGITATRYNAKYIAENDKEKQRAVNGMFFVLYCGIACVCCVIGYILYINIPNIYDHYAKDSIVLVQKLFLLAIVNLIFTLIFQVFNAIINAYEKFVFAKTIVFIQTVFGPIGMLVVLNLGYRSVGMIMFTTSLTLIFGIVQMLYCFYKLKVKFYFNKFDKALFITIMSFTLFVFLNSLSHQLFGNSDKIIVSILLSEASIAVYAIVIQFHVYFYNFANVLSGFYLPRFTKAVRDTKSVSKLLMDDIIRTGRIQLIIAGFIFGGFIALGHSFIIRWVGPDYEQAYYLVIFVFFCEYISSSQSMFNSLMQAMNLHKLRSIIGLSSAVIKVLITILFVYIWGLWGCAVAYLIGYMIRFFAYNLYYRYVGIDIAFFWREILKLLIPLTFLILLLSCSFIILQQFINFNSYIVIVIFALLYSTLFFLLLWHFFLNGNEKRIFQSIYYRLISVFKNEG